MGSIRGTLTSSISLNSLENALFCVNSFRQVAQTGSFINSETSNFKIPIPIFISMYWAFHKVSTDAPEAKLEAC